MEDGRQNNFGTIFCPVSLKFLFEKIAMIVILMNLILMILMVLVLMILIFLFDWSKDLLSCTELLKIIECCNQGGLTIVYLEHCNRALLYRVFHFVVFQKKRSSKSFAKKKKKSPLYQEGGEREGNIFGHREPRPSLFANFSRQFDNKRVSMALERGPNNVLGWQKRLKQNSFTSLSRENDLPLEVSKQENK